MLNTRRNLIDAVVCNRITFVSKYKNRRDRDLFIHNKAIFDREHKFKI